VGEDGGKGTRAADQRRRLTLAVRRQRSTGPRGKGRFPPIATPRMMQLSRSVCLAAALLAPVPLAGQELQSASSSMAVPQWAFPRPRPTTGAGKADSVRLRHVPRSTRAYTDAQIASLFSVPDWHPASHPRMPPVVENGRRPTVFACGYCHLPDGQGRPENAALAGLPAAYIEQQVADIKSGARKMAGDKPFGPFESMRLAATGATDAEIADAAAYFARLPLRRRPRVVESATIPHTVPGNGLYFKDTIAGDEPLGARLLEVAASRTQHERHDSETRYVTYVPLGSIARGRALATVGARRDSTKACATCHGADLRGVGLAPPIAGRSPSYILRQLIGFKVGARAAPSGALMRDVAQGLTLDDMIAAAAYAASRAP